eukprot:TRINITY_DN354_c0_g1_i5.p1 TRINITY_DN354_c0_g1~~TRINITY_DN354_c0_g1_i5.p1  ORF type:complete len:130 (-),score=20.61 TRINITY_DN354_c0_g1_i5:162-551(-)
MENKSNVTLGSSSNQTKNQSQFERVFIRKFEQLCELSKDNAIVGALWEEGTLVQFSLPNVPFPQFNQSPPAASDITTTTTTITTTTTMLIPNPPIVGPTLQITITKTTGEKHTHDENGGEGSSKKAKVD